MAIVGPGTDLFLGPTKYKCSLPGCQAMCWPVCQAGVPFPSGFEWSMMRGPVVLRSSRSDTPESDPVHAIGRRCQYRLIVYQRSAARATLDSWGPGLLQGRSSRAQRSDLPLRTGDRFGAKGAPRDGKVWLPRFFKRHCNSPSEDLGRAHSSAHDCEQVLGSRARLSRAGIWRVPISLQVGT